MSKACVSHVILLLVLAIFNGVYTQDTNDSFVRRGWHASFVFDKYLYIDGGEVTKRINGTISKSRGNSTRSIDLSKAWTNATVEFRHVFKREGTLWNQNYQWSKPGENAIYQWGGQQSLLPGGGDTPKSTLSKFVPDGNGLGTWTTDIGTASNSGFGALVRSVAGATTFTDEAWYAYGGCGGSATDLNIDGAVLLNALVTYNFSSGQWTNTSMDAITPGEGLTFAEAHSVLTVSQKSVNIILGGGTIPGYWLSRIPWGWPSSWSSMATVNIHDPTTNTFYVQATTGEAPTARYQFCSVGARGKNKTYEIFIYGGVTRGADVDTYNANSDAVYVLSIPAFRWFKVEFAPFQARAQHTCNVDGAIGSQMIVVGGYEPFYGFDNFSVITNDPWPNGLNVFDLNDWVWKTSYDPNAQAYQTHPIVQDWYARSYNSSDVFENATLADIFLKSSTASASSTRSGTNVSIMAGSIVGVFVVVGLLLWLWLRRGWYRSWLPRGCISFRRKDSSNFGKFRKSEMEDTSLKIPYVGLEVSKLSHGLGGLELDSDYQRCELDAAPCPTELEAQSTTVDSTVHELA